MQEFIGTFHIDWKLMIAQLINFGIVFLVFYFLAAKPLRKLMEERGNTISKGLDDAKESSELLQKASEEYKQNTKKLRQVAIDSQKALTKELDQLRAKNLEKIKADNNEWAKKRAEQMEIDKKALVESAKSEVISLAMLAVKKIMAEENKQNK
ncbi:MAG: ATP synthase F0 subunit B [Candidatus Pacebacteria bacterium]|nr:ATP synthase F0 subunit B [Candidatus Paceibacterota bacterium]